MYWHCEICDNIKIAELKKNISSQNSIIFLLTQLSGDTLFLVHSLIKLI